MQTKPNVLLISIDTCRADFISSYGYPKCTTPHFDRLAEDGVLFLNHFSTGVWTPPGHASIFTGLLVHEHGVYGNRKLATDIPTIAEILSRDGYQTAGFVNNSQVGAFVGLERGHETFIEVWQVSPYKNLIDRIFRGGFRRVRDFWGIEDKGAKRTIFLFREWLRNIDRKRPFYCFIHFIEPHNPLRPHRKYRKRFVRGTEQIRSRVVSKVARNPLVMYLKDWELKEAEVAYLKNLYAAEIAYTDEMVGTVVNFLRDEDFYDNTTIIVTSDHGEHFGEHGMWSHVSSLHDEVLRVPLVIKYPREYNLRYVCNHITQSTDVLPTILDSVGILDLSLDLSGMSLLSSNYDRKYFFAEWEGRIPYYILNQVGARDGGNISTIEKLKEKKIVIGKEEFRYIRYESGKEELWKVTEEGCSLVPDKEISGEMMKEMRNIYETKGFEKVFLAENADVNLDDEVLQNLKALGYI